MDQMALADQPEGVRGSHRVFLLLSAILVACAVYIFESGRYPLRVGYACLMLGSVPIALYARGRVIHLREVMVEDSCQMVSRHGAVISMRIGASLVALVALHIAWRVVSQQRFASFADINSACLLWASMIVLMVLAAWIWDRTRLLPIQRERFFTWYDAWWCAAIVAVAGVLRMGGPLTHAVDESYVFRETLTMQTVPVSPWAMSSQSYPFLLHWFIDRVRWLSDPFVDAFALHRALSIAASSLSVMFLYSIVRLFASRAAAGCAALLVATMGWHWVNSRFMYVYPYDLALISLGVLVALIAFETQRATYAVATGIVCGLTVISKKIAIMDIAVVAYLFLDYLLTGGARNRIRACVTVLIIGVVCLIVAAPTWQQFFPRDYSQEAGFFVYRGAMNDRTEKLAAYGLTPVSGMVYVVLDAFRQFQISSYDSYRHVLRLGEPILDPILSGLCSIGVCVSVIGARRRRDYRIALACFLIFLLPMILAFPTGSDQPHGVARRMLGASFFLAWLGIIGAHAIALSLASRAWQERVVAMLTLASITATGYLYYNVYLHQPRDHWVFSNGLYRNVLVETVRASAPKVTSVVVLQDDWTSLLGSAQDIKNLTVTQTKDDFRNAIMALGPGKHLVVFAHRHNPWMHDIFDLVPQSAWSPPRQDPNGEPILFTALLER